MLLRALAEQDYASRRFECVVVDNGSKVPVRIDQQFEFEVRVLREDRKGGYVARNTGLRTARGTVLAFTDSDCIPRSDWLSSAVARLREADQRPTMIGGKIEVVTSGPTPSSVAEWHSLVHDLDQARYVSAFHFAATANLVVGCDVFATVGEFDESLYSGGDFDWGRRAWSGGVDQVYADEVVVRHPTRTSWRTLITRHRRLIGGQYVMNQRTGGSVGRVVKLVVKTALASARRALRDPRMTPTERIQVTTLDAALRCIQLVECARLSLGGGPLRA
ncbi:MAG: glycosyltransferase [Myxococcota bacterium]|nr:glycosyltransferase [Myxococcota bacterium]